MNQFLLNDVQETFIKTKQLPLAQRPYLFKNYINSKSQTEMQIYSWQYLSKWYVLHIYIYNFNM